MYLMRTYQRFFGYWSLFRYCVQNLNKLQIEPIKERFYYQVYFTGVKALASISVLALLSGTLVITQITNLVGGNSELTVKILIWTLVQEVGPLLAGIIIIARSSAALASELAIMKAQGELTHLVQMQITPNDYLLIPRFAGVTLAVMALSIYFQVIAIGGGFAISALFQSVSYTEQVERFLQIVRFSDLMMVALKGWIFGMMIAIISCYHGLYASDSLSDVPSSAMNAVMRSLLSLFLLDILLAYLIHY